MTGKPQPTRLKIIKGNPGKRPLNECEPQPELVDLKPLPGLSKSARKHWRLIAKQLSEAKILTEIDKPALMAYCEAYARWRDTMTDVQQKGLLVKAPSGYPIQNPYLSIANKAFEQMCKIMSEFGMTPSSRSKIQIVDDSKKRGNEWDGI